MRARGGADERQAAPLLPTCPAAVVGVFCICNCFLLLLLLLLFVFCFFIFFDSLTCFIALQVAAVRIPTVTAVFTQPACAMDSSAQKYKQ